MACGGLARDQVMHVPLLQQTADGRHVLGMPELVHGVVLMPVVLVDVAVQPGDKAVLGEEYGGFRVGMIEPGDDGSDGRSDARVRLALAGREGSVEILVIIAGTGQKI